MHRRPAALLGISPQRVENLKRRVYAKLAVSSGAHAGVRNRSGALAVADAFGLLPPGALPPV